MSLEDLKVELLRSEFPSLRPDHDPDIERYFDLRAAGRPADALAFYESRIRPRYPDDAYRTAALRAYRLRDPSYSDYIAKAYAELGGRLLERTKRMIKYVAMYASSYDRRDAYATIKAAESILGMLPRDRFEAVAAVERLRRHAELLDYQAGSLEIAEELVRSYLNEQLDVVEAERERRRREAERGIAERRSRLVRQDMAETKRSLEEDRRREAERRKAKKPVRAAAKPVVVLDLSAIRFSAADLARMQIPPTLAKVEDKTLAFCFKYWNLVEDRAFERVLFLFARKYGVKHYDIYSAIRDGRRRGRRDEEILAAVSGLLTTGYYYSIRGDKYLQHNWARLKAKIDPGADIQAKKRPRRQAELQSPAVQAAGSPTIPVQAAQPVAETPVVETPRQPVRAAAEKAEPRRMRTVKAPKSSAPRNVPRRAVDGTKKNAPLLVIEKKRSENEQPAVREKAQTAAIVGVFEPRLPKGSVSDRLRKLSGKSYDVFQDRFLSKARAAIRSVLSETRNGKKSLFPSVTEDAEELVYSFLKDHYSNPYMDWETSPEKNNLSSLGYELESLDPIIENCFRRL